MGGASVIFHRFIYFHFHIICNRYTNHTRIILNILNDNKYIHHAEEEKILNIFCCKFKTFEHCLLLSFSHS